MTNFDDDIRRISVLVNDLGDGRDGDAWDRCRVVLEAAGRVLENSGLPPDHILYITAFPSGEQEKTALPGKATP